MLSILLAVTFSLGVCLVVTFGVAGTVALASRTVRLSIALVRQVPRMRPRVDPASGSPGAEPPPAG